MGLTLIRKSTGNQPKKDARVALVLAGGAVTGGGFKVGGLKALNDFLVDRKITDFDVYVGLSAGSLLSVPLAAGIDPDEMVAVLEGTSGQLEQLRPVDYYTPNVAEFASRPSMFAYDLMSYLPGVTFEFLRSVPGLRDALGDRVGRLWQEPTYQHFESLVMGLVEHVSPSREMPALTNHIPSGLFDASGLEQWLRRNLDRIGIPNDFRAFERKLQRKLYIAACDLDTAERVVFGADENAEVTISQAVQASSSLPLFYKPARINGIDYVDGGVRNTANIDVAVEKGADLVICYNPFRPFLNRIDDDVADASYFANGRYLSDRGLKVVLNQVFRTMLHSRLKIGMQRYLADDRFQGDIVLLEPREQDANFFALNPLAFWRREQAVAHGFESVRSTIEHNFDQLSEVFGAYGLEMSRAEAQRKADAVRVDRGWVDTRAKERTEEPAEARLRLVGS